MCLVPYVLSWLTNLGALDAFVSHVPLLVRALVIHPPRALRALVLYVSFCLTCSPEHEVFETEKVSKIQSI